MVFEKIESLKEKGNAAFADEKYEESTKLYLEAITLYKSQIHSEIADMYANCVEASLKQEKYELAITDADQALEFDPTSIKCLFHRATANLKLDTIKEAAVDLRKVLSLDPHHSEANSLLREIVPPTKIEKPLRSVFVGHYLRRPLLNPCGTDAESKKYFWKNMKLPLLRMTFLSAQNSRSAHRFFAGITVSELQSTSDVCLRLSPWFAANHLMCEYNLNSVVNAILSKKAAVLMLQLINPANSTLAFSTIKFVGEFGQHKFSNVICQDESKILTDEQSSSGAEIIKGVASLLTRLPYFPDISNFEGEFPKLKCVVIASTFSINFNFLKAWFEYKWPVDHVVFSEVLPNLATFKTRFNKFPVSKRVHKLHLPFAVANTEISDMRNLTKATGTYLDILKRVFSNLKEVTGTLDFKFERPEAFSTFISKKLKEYVAFLVAQVNKKIKPQWCSKLRVLVNVVNTSGNSEEMHSDMVNLANVYIACRKEIKLLKSIEMAGPSVVTFDWKQGEICFALMELETVDVQFQFAFKSIPKNSY